jgi:small subunit ribosomal protein S20
MPIKKAAKKALRQSKKRRAKNRVQKEKMRTLLKKIGFLISKNKIDEAKKVLPDVYKSLDKAAKINLIKKNTASRIKSRITKALIKPGIVKKNSAEPAEPKSR